MKTKIIAICLVLCTLLLASCGNRGEITEGGFVDSETGIEYVPVTPMGLYPVEADEEYITVKEGEVETVYYKVWFEQPSRFLCYESEGNYFLMRASTVEEPNASEFAPIAAFIYNSTNTVRVDSFFADNQYIPEDQQDDVTVGETALCTLVANSIVNGEAVEVPVTHDNIKSHFYIRLLSQDYPGLYYLVSFFGYNGRYFLRDDAMGKTVYCPNDIITRMVGDGLE